VIVCDFYQIDAAPFPFKFELVAPTCATPVFSIDSVKQKGDRYQPCVLRLVASGSRNQQPYCPTSLVTTSHPPRVQA